MQKKILYKKKITIGDLKVNIYFKSNFVIINNFVIFGYPLDIKKKKNLKLSEIKNISGYFFVIKFTKNNILFYTDATANLRVYYYQNKNNIYISDDLNKIINIYKKKIKINKILFNFFKEKNYTPGNTTFFDEISKFAPCSKYFFKNETLKNKNYFPDYENKPDINIIQKKIVKYFSYIFKKLKSKKVVLLFSGGKDSLLIFYFLIYNKINFECAFYDTYKKSDTSINKEFVKKICKEKNIKLTIVHVSLKKNNKFKKFFSTEMIFDYHLSILHFNFFEKIKKIYEKDTIFITGQSCDSVLSLGPSQYTLSNFIARFINKYPNNIFNYIFCKILNKKFKSHLETNNQNEFYYSFYYSFFYYSLNNFKKNSLLKIKIKDIVDKLKSKKKNKNSILIFLKCHGFLQGPDNQIIIKSANFNNFNNILMPFASLNFISIISKYYNSYLDLFFPKYIIDLILIKKFKTPVIDLLGNIFFRTFRRSKNVIELSKINNKFKKETLNQITKKYES